MSWSRPTPLGIDPRVDVVFHKLFGDPANADLLVAFLNAVLRDPVPIRTARVLNPFTRALSPERKDVVIDVLAEDDAGRRHGIEMQRFVHRGLLQRVLFGAARLYSSQLHKGEDYGQLRPVVSIWLCATELFPQREPQLTFRLLDQGGRELHSDVRVDVLQLARWASAPHEVDPQLAPWYAFFNEASSWREVPAAVAQPELERAMRVLEEFESDPELDHLYRQRLAWERLEAERRRLIAEADERTRVAEERSADLQRGIEERDRAREEADRAREEADRAREEADQRAAELKHGIEEADRAREEADRAREEADRAREEADRALQAAEREIAALRARLAGRDDG